MKLLRNGSSVHVGKPSHQKYVWNSKNVDLVELCYALIEGHCVTNQDNSLIKIDRFIKDFSSIFSAKIEEPSRIFYDIKRRKVENRATFLHFLQDALNIRMDKDDNK